MKKVLLTGGTGFIGRNIIPYLSEVCALYTPNRTELNLTDAEKVRDYLRKNKFDVVIHSANPNPVKNDLDKKERMFEDSIRTFMNLYQENESYEKMFVLGSGAEYNKLYDICQASEYDIGKTIPADEYGLSKFVINTIARESKNLYNFRIFAIYGPTDHESKFITHCIRCCMENKPITINQNCYFDYMYVDDLAKFINYGIYNDLEFHDYNVCSGVRVTLYDIAKEVQEQMNNENEIIFLNEGWNREYTGSNKRLLNELKNDFVFTPLKVGISKLIDSERRNLK